MAKENGNGKAILIAIIICVIIGVFFVLGLDKKIVSFVKNRNSVMEQRKLEGNIMSNQVLSDIPAIPNLVVVYGGVFSVNEIIINENETVSFYNADQSPIKVIGDGWQSAFIDNAGVFTKGDLTKGEYTAYLESNPNEVIKIKVK